MQNYIVNYLNSTVDFINDINISQIERILVTIDKVRMDGNRLFVCGNGGSAAHAMHFAGDLAKNVTSDEVGRFNVISLCDNITAFTAYSNDIGYDVVFSEQMKNFNLTKGDCLLGISSSGNSPNIVKACEYAKTKGACIIGLCGFTGGKLKQMADFYLHINSNEYEKVEDLHMIVLHIIVSYFKNNKNIYPRLGALE